MLRNDPIRSFGVFPRVDLIEEGDTMVFLYMGEHLKSAHAEVFAPNGDQWEPLKSYVSSPQVTAQQALTFARRVYQPLKYDKKVLCWPHRMCERHRRVEEMNAWACGEHLKAYSDMRDIYLDMILNHRNNARTLGIYADRTLCHFATASASSRHITPAQFKKQLEDTMRRREKVTATSPLWERVSDLMPLEDAKKIFAKLDKILYLELGGGGATRRTYMSPSVHFIYRYEAYLKESGQI